MIRFIATLALVCAAASASAFSLGSRHALVIDAQSGEVLLEKSPDSVVPIASLTKLMTAMVVLDAMPDMDEQVEITDDDVDTLKHSSSRVPVGAVLPRRTLLELALMSSDNRAAHALARTYPGGMQAFLDQVHAKQQEIGMEHTVLIEPTGLSPHNRSTAQDVARMALAASNYPQIREITTSAADDIEINGADRPFHNTNRFVGNAKWNILLSKTGYTREAGRCIVMHVHAAGRNAIMVLLNASETVVRSTDAIKLRSLVDGSPFLEASYTPPLPKVRLHHVVGVVKTSHHRHMEAVHARAQHHAGRHAATRHKHKR
ncbi:D-alanyl-D-alanine carboxypeptidase family protein [Noviherbaspirillum pedocola]|uniref:Serine hydrolase n=1 Tax=Noviherbaspirillum pedocola TaxID=2801341 RepID=A0A934W7C3_9BURK|nr:serine hydrolase [Noviherbaspirillum pedocola]MBK4736195.1 serine hydrolase [Noviherbaspirillum pedocola]